MNKLLREFESTNYTSFKVAAKIVNHAIKHPMSLCIMSEKDSATYNRAEDFYQNN